MWTDTDKEELKALKNAPTKMVDTAYGRYKAEQKRNVVRLCRKMMPEEREDLRRSLKEIDTSTTATANDAAAAANAAAANEPTNITPI